jgi:hypothetical protein
MRRHLERSRDRMFEGKMLRRRPFTQRPPHAPPPAPIPRPGPRCSTRRPNPTPSPACTPCPRSRLGFAVQLVYLRHPGQALGLGERPPAAMLAHVAGQVGADPVDETRREHLAELQ